MSARTLDAPDAGKGRKCRRDTASPGRVFIAVQGGLKGWGIIEGIALGRNITRSASLQGSSLSKVSWKIDHRKEGQ